MAKNKVYLIPTEEYIYTACVAQKPPTANAILLTTEGTYPMKCYYQRYDMNGDAIIGAHECMTQEELIELLNWNGRCQHKILCLWDFNYRETNNDAVIKLFDGGYDRQMEIICEEVNSWIEEDFISGWYEDDDSDHDNGSEDFPDVVIPF